MNFFNTNQLNEEEKEKMIQSFQNIYNKHIRVHFSWLPESILDISSFNIQNLFAIERILGVSILYDLFYLRSSVLKLKKSL